MRSKLRTRLRRLALRAVQGALERTFPKVDSIEPEELQRLLQRGDEERPILLDVRSQSEFDCSHLHGALHVPTPTWGSLDTRGLRASAERARSRDPHATLVVYCSVGLRSARVVAELQNSGLGHVLNLSEGIFGWANRGLELAGASREAPRVHPFGRPWAWLLSPEYRDRPH